LTGDWKKWSSDSKAQQKEREKFETSNYQFCSKYWKLKEKLKKARKSLRYKVRVCERRLQTQQYPTPADQQLAVANKGNIEAKLREVN
jgi:hypothetical protein